MAMNFREPNQVLWRGVRPGHNGIQVFGAGTATETAIDVYEVTAGKTLYLTYMQLNCNNSAGIHYGDLRWTDDSNVLQNILILHQFDGAGQLSNAVALPFPIEIPAGHKIRVNSVHAELDASATIFGWEE